jgi:phage tail-like protein
MAELTFKEGYTTHGFALEIAGVRCPVTKVGGLSEGTMDVIAQPEGGATFERKIASGIVKFDNLTIERVVDGSPFDAFFQEWFSEMFLLDGRAFGSSVRRNGAILKTNYHGDEQVRWVFTEGWIVSSKFTDLEAGSANLFKQTVEIAHSGLKRVV